MPTPGALPFNVEILTLINNLVKVGQIVNMISIGMGVFFILVGFFKLKRYGEMRTFMSQQMTILAPMMYLMVGSLLLYLPTTLHLFASMVWTNTNPMQPSPKGGAFYFINAMYIFIRLLGVIGIIRGLAGLASAGGQGQPGKITKSFLFILGGIMCLHISGTVDIIESLMGWI